MQRLYCQEPLNQTNEIEFSKEHLHYLVNVLRLKTGDQILLFNGRDGEWLSTLTLTKKIAHACPEKQTRHVDTPPVITLCFVPIKLPRLKIMIEKATELGVTHFQPIQSQHQQVPLKKYDTLEKIAIEAAEQSNRLNIPTFLPEQSLSELLTSSKAPLHVALERSRAKTLLRIALKPPVNILIGPEGGFSAKEREMLLSASNVEAFSLGENILRAETAAIASLSALSLLNDSA